MQSQWQDQLEARMERVKKVYDPESNYKSLMLEAIEQWDKERAYFRDEHPGSYFDSEFGYPDKTYPLDEAYIEMYTEALKISKFNIEYSVIVNGLWDHGYDFSEIDHDQLSAGFLMALCEKTEQEARKCREQGKELTKECSDTIYLLERMAKDENFFTQEEAQRLKENFENHKYIYNFMKAENQAAKLTLQALADNITGTIAREMDKSMELLQLDMNGAKNLQEETRKEVVGIGVDTIAEAGKACVESAKNTAYDLIRTSTYTLTKQNETYGNLDSFASRYDEEARLMFRKEQAEQKSFFGKLRSDITKFVSGVDQGKDLNAAKAELKESAKADREGLWKKLHKHLPFAKTNEANDHIADGFVKLTDTWAKNAKEGKVMPLEQAAQKMTQAYCKQAEKILSEQDKAIDQAMQRIEGDLQLAIDKIADRQADLSIAYGDALNDHSSRAAELLFERDKYERKLNDETDPEIREVLERKIKTLEQLYREERKEFNQADHDYTTGMNQLKEERKDLLSEATQKAKTFMEEQKQKADLELQKAMDQVNASNDKLQLDRSAENEKIAITPKTMDENTKKFVDTMHKSGFIKNFHDLLNKESRLLRKTQHNEDKINQMLDKSRQADDLNRTFEQFKEIAEYGEAHVLKTFTLEDAQKVAELSSKADKQNRQADELLKTPVIKEEELKQTIDQMNELLEKADAYTELMNESTYAQDAVQHHTERLKKEFQNYAYSDYIQNSGALLEVNSDKDRLTGFYESTTEHTRLNGSALDVRKQIMDGAIAQGLSPMAMDALANFANKYSSQTTEMDVCKVENKMNGRESFCLSVTAENGMQENFILDLVEKGRDAGDEANERAAENFMVQVSAIIERNLNKDNLLQSCSTIAGRDQDGLYMNSDAVYKMFNGLGQQLGIETSLKESGFTDKAMEQELGEKSGVSIDDMFGFDNKQ